MFIALWYALNEYRIVSVVDNAYILASVDVYEMLIICKTLCLAAGLRLPNRYKEINALRFIYVPDPFHRFPKYTFINYPDFPLLVVLFIHDK